MASTLDGQEVEVVHVLSDHAADLLVVVVVPLAPRILFSQAHQVRGPVLAACVGHGSVSVTAEDQDADVVLHELLVVRHQRVLQNVAVVVAVHSFAANSPLNVLLVHVDRALNFGFLHKSS